MRIAAFYCLIASATLLAFSPEQLPMAIQLEDTTIVGHSPESKKLLDAAQTVQAASRAMIEAQNQGYAGA